MHTLTIQSHERTSFIPITHAVQKLISQQTWLDGALILFCPHTTCGITINEGADPDVATDMTHFFNTAIPQSNQFRHAEGNSDAHIKASILGSSLHLIVEKGQLCLGTWQCIYLFDGDGPRSRKLWVQWLTA